MQIDAVETTVREQIGDRRAIAAQRGVAVRVAGGKAAGNDAQLWIDAVDAVRKSGQSVVIVLAWDRGLHVGLVDRGEDGRAPIGNPVFPAPIATWPEPLRHRLPGGEPVLIRPD